MDSYHLIRLHRDFILGVVDIILGDALGPFYAPQIIINYIKPPKHFSIEIQVWMVNLFMLLSIIWNPISICLIFI